jgi:hypothetical protein
MATCHAALGRDEEAVKQFRQGLVEEAKPGMQQTGLWGSFCWFVLQRGRVDLYEEARAAANAPGRHMLFPVDRYRLGAIESFSAVERGERGLAIDWARKALEAAEADHSGFRYHPKVGLVHEQGKSDEAIREELERLASGKA